MSIYPLLPSVRVSFRTIAIAALLNAVGASAADTNKSAPVPSEVDAAIALRQAYVATAHQHAQAHLVPVGKTAVAAGQNGFPNPSRAYPPSCLADGVPYGQASTDPHAQHTTLTLNGYDSSGNAVAETDTFTLFRVPCSSVSGGASVTLLEIDRPAAAAATSYMFFPSIVVKNSAGTQYPPRLPEDPNTVWSDTAFAGQLSFSSIYVLEYYYGDTATSILSGGASVDYNQAFTMSIVDVISRNSVNVSLPAYDPSVFNYPSATNPQEITGYLSGPWFNSNSIDQGGMTIEIYDGSPTTRTFAAIWYTYDITGVPFWLVAQAGIPIKDTTPGQTNGYQVINVPAQYVTGGNLNANSNAAVTYHDWGTMSFSFPNCGTMNFTYTNTSGASGNVPIGSGTRQFIRLANINGVACQ